MRKIRLTHGYYALVDNKDYKRLCQYNWSLYVNVGNKRSIYPRACINGTIMLMHQLLKKKKAGFVTDHRNKNGLDNRRTNLRYVTLSQNAVNSRIGKNNSSGYTGVNKEGTKWRARIWKDWKCNELGNFDTFKEAKKARIAAEKKYFPKIIIERKSKVKFIHLTRTPVPEVKRYSNATSKYKGVYPRGKKWFATIRFKRKQIYLGTYYSEKLAAEAFIDEFKKIYGIEPYRI